MAGRQGGAAMTYALSFLSVSLTMSAVIVLVHLFNLASAQWVPARLRYAVWVAVLVGLLIPLRPAVGDGLVTVPVTQQIAVAPAAAAQAAPAISQIESRAISPAALLLIAWATVAAGIFLYHIWRYFRFRNTVRRWGRPVLDEDVLRLYEAVKREKGLEGKDIELVRCKLVSTSILTGFLQPVIVLPDKDFNAEELELIFRHELIHYKRGDLFVKLFATFALALHWFNPIVYRMASAMQTECEASCDEAVLREVGEGNRLFYAELIIEMVGRKQTSAMLSTCFYGGKRSLKRRLASIMDGTYNMKKPAYAALLLIVMLMAMSGSVFAFSIREAPIYDVTNREVRPQNPPITREAAIEIALAFVDEGTLDEASIDFEQGRWVWEIEIDLPDRRELEVLIDIITGEIIAMEWD